MDDLQILLHLIELGLFLLSMLFVAMKNTKIIQKQPLKTIVLITIFVTILGGIALCIFDIILFLWSSHFDL